MYCVCEVIRFFFTWINMTFTANCLFGQQYEETAHSSTLLYCIYRPGHNLMPVFVYYMSEFLSSLINCKLFSWNAALGNNSRSRILSFWKNYARNISSVRWRCRPQPFQQLTLPSPQLLCSPPIIWAASKRRASWSQRKYIHHCSSHPGKRARWP